MTPAFQRFLPSGHGSSAIAVPRSSRWQLNTLVSIESLVGNYQLSTSLLSCLPRCRVSSSPRTACSFMITEDPAGHRVQILRDDGTRRRAGLSRSLARGRRTWRGTSRWRGGLEVALAQDVGNQPGGGGGSEPGCAMRYQSRRRRRAWHRQLGQPPCRELCATASLEISVTPSPTLADSRIAPFEPLSGSAA